MVQKPSTFLLPAATTRHVSMSPPPSLGQLTISNWKFHKKDHYFLIITEHIWLETDLTGNSSWLLTNQTSLRNIHWNHTPLRCCRLLLVRLWGEFIYLFIHLFNLTAYPVSHPKPWSWLMNTWNADLQNIFYKSIIVLHQQSQKKNKNGMVSTIQILQA